jgi:nucleotide-binding universal stress UspA family protein
VLATTDLSEIGDSAIPFAYALPRRGGSVILLHVIEPVTVPNPLYAHYAPGRAPTAAERAAQEAELREKLRALVPSGAAARGIKTEIALVEGRDVARCIAEAAGRLRADALCIASHGRSGLARTLLGSVAHAVLLAARLPTLIVPRRRS